MEELLNLVNSVAFSGEPDSWTWSLAGDGNSLISLARIHVDEGLCLMKGSYTGWSKLVPIKVNILAWRICLNKLPSRFNMSLRGLGIPFISCPVCLMEVETIDHLFFSCLTASDIIAYILVWWELPFIGLSLFLDWQSWFDRLKIRRERRRQRASVRRVKALLVDGLRRRDRPKLRQFFLALAVGVFAIGEDAFVMKTREEFCLITGLRFEDLDLADYNNREMPIPFKRRVFPSCYDGEHITSSTILEIIEDDVFDRIPHQDVVSLCCLGILQLVFLGVEAKHRIPDWMLRLANDRVGWDNFPWGSFVWPTLYSQLKNANVKHWLKLYASQDTTEIDKKVYLVFRYTWAFKGNMPAKRLTPAETEARAKWWISSRAYFDGATPYWQPAFPSHLGTYNWQSLIPSHMGNTNLQPPIVRHHVAPDIFNQNILNRGKREQRPSYYKQSPYMEQPPTTILPKQCGGDNVAFLGGRFTGNYLVYENVDPQKVRREHYITLQEFLNIPRSVYLDCYMKGYSVPVTFWKQLVPHLCPPDCDSGTLMGWLSGEMNAWVELLIRYRTNNDPWTVAYTNTISVHPENQGFLIETDQHTIGTLDGSTRLYPAWSAVNWVFLPIHVAGNHWVTGVIDLPNSHFYVFDSLPNEGTMNLLRKQIQRWTPVVNSILQGRGCFNETRGPYNF
ncbi:phospholipase-like protein [Tanacetum coccineum]